MDRLSERRVASLFLVVLLALAALRFYSHHNTLELIDAGRWAAHAQKVEGELDAMLAALEEAEAAWQGYQASGDPGRAADFADARRRTAEQAARLRQESKNSPVQRGRVQRLEKLVQAEMEALERAGGPRAPAADESSFARIRAAAAEVRSEEANVLGGYLAAAQGRARREFWVSAVSTAIVAGLLVFGYWLLLRHFAHRRRARAEIDRLNEDLHRKVDELEKLFNVVPVGVIITEDPQCLSMRGNAVMAGMLGVPPGFNLSKSAPGDEQPGYRVFAAGRELGPEELPMQVAASTGAAAKDVEFDLLLGDRTVALCGNVVPLLDGRGRPRGAVGAFWDCADWRAREERLLDERDAAEAAAAAKEDMLVTVSHDLRTPLAAIRLLATILKRKPVEQVETGDIADRILRMCDAQGRLMDDVLDLARITHGKLTLDKQPVGLADVVRAACDMVRPVAEAGGIRLDIAIADGEHRVMGEFARLQQVLWNLLSNALKFTPTDGSVGVSLRRAGPAVEVRVADTGRGIDPNVLPHIFDRFWKGSSHSGALDRSGLGLGLAIAKHVVELHDGTITAESDGKDRGAAFTVRLPLADDRKDGERTEVVSLGGGNSPPDATGVEAAKRSSGQDGAAAEAPVPTN